MRDKKAVTDFHTHILPGIDDGSQSEVMTEAMLREEESQGVSMVVATPHFYADRMSVERFLARRNEALERVEAIRGKNPSLPDIAVGAEVLYFPGMGQAREISKLCIGKSPVLLLEMPFEQWTDAVLKDIRELQNRQALKLVLAHVERYVGFQRDWGVWNRIMELDVTFQLNAGSFLHKGALFGNRKKTQFCLRFLAEHPNAIIGSDCHNVTSRRPNLSEARAVIAEKLGQEALDRIDGLTGEMLRL